MMTYNCIGYQGCLDVGPEEIVCERVDVFSGVTKSGGVHYKDLVVVVQALDLHLLFKASVLNHSCQSPCHLISCKAEYVISISLLERKQK